MTHIPESENPPIFDLDRFHRDHLSTVEFVDIVAVELGMALPAGAPRPALIKTNRPAKENPAEIKRELWKNPTLPEKLDTTIVIPDGTEEDARLRQQSSLSASSDARKAMEDKSPGQESSGEVSASLREDGIRRIPLRSSSYEGQAEDEKKWRAKAGQHTTEEPPPFRIRNTIKSLPDKPKPLELSDDYIQDIGRETGWLRVIIDAVMLIAFITVDCHYAMHESSGYMLTVRLAVFGVGLLFALATAWRAAGKKLVMSIIIIALFLFHFNNNKPILSIVEKFHEHPHSEEAE